MYKYTYIYIYLCQCSSLSSTGFDASVPIKSCRTISAHMNCVARCVYSTERSVCTRCM